MSYNLGGTHMPKMPMIGYFEPKYMDKISTNVNLIYSTIELVGGPMDPYKLSSNS